MLKRGDLFPHVSVQQLNGTPFSYREIWQERNLLLVSLPPAAAGGGDRALEKYVADLAAEDETLRGYDTTVVVTRAPIPGVPSPAVVVADRWGEIAAMLPAGEVAALPPVNEVVDWLRFVAHACPECEGEAR
jgi:hypothetical protein